MDEYIKKEDAIEAVTSLFRVSALFSGMSDNEEVWRQKAEKVLAKCEVVIGKVYTPQTDYKKWDVPPKVNLPTGEISTCVSIPAWAISYARKFLGYACETCKHRDEEWDSEACDGCCENNDHYEKDEPQTIVIVKDHGRKQALEMTNLYHKLKTEQTEREGE